MQDNNNEKKILIINSTLKYRSSKKCSGIIKVANDYLIKH